MLALHKRKRISVLGMQTDVISIDEATSHITQELIPSVQNTGGKYICASNVHMCMEAYDNKSYKHIVNNADLVCPDGRPMVWAQKLFGEKTAKQVRGYDISLALCKKAADLAIPVGFYGASKKHLQKIQNVLKQKYPRLKINCAIAPPFRTLTEKEDQEYINQINDSGVKILFVGLGCPKQERWMADHKNKLHCVMLGVGAVFDFISGEKKHAPKIISNVGMEWLFRLACEPTRLAGRYLKHNPRFIWHMAKSQFKKQRYLSSQ